MSLAVPTQLATRSSNTSGQTSYVSASVTFPAASLGVLEFDNAGGSAYPTGVTDSAGNTWTIVQHASRNAFNWTISAYCLFPSSTTCTVTVAFASSNETFGWLGYTSGHDTTTPKDADGNNSTFGTSLAVSTSTTLAANDEIVFVVFSDSVAPSAWPPTNYTSLFAPVDGVRGFGANFGYRLFSGGTGSGTTETVTANWAASRQIAAGIITFKPAAGGTTPVTVTPSAANVVFSSAAAAQAATAVTPAPASTVFAATAAATAQTAVSPAAADAVFSAAASVSTAAPVDLGTVTAAATFAAASAATAMTVVAPSSADAAFTATSAVTASPVVAGSAATTFAATAAAAAPTVVAPAAATSVYGASAVVTTPGTPAASSRLPLIGVGT